eukprot:TRINITY_DN31955_c0_g1_i1.p1 TRINITY_DN31955_c0_g1~~TRINITY_DN31955_c0_g1_i1.p1  ORF type:complete len:565 (-),score=124.17 TRINITY_DN31955_c0_g1_i1:6-1463(-)
MGAGHDNDDMRLKFLDGNALDAGAVAALKREDQLDHQVLMEHEAQDAVKREVQLDPEDSGILVNAEQNIKDMESSEDAVVEGEKEKESPKKQEVSKELGPGDFPNPDGVLRDFTIKGGDFRNWFADSLEACQSRCKNESDCIAWTFEGASRMCWLKDMIIYREKVFHPQSNVHSGWIKASDLTCTRPAHKLEKNASGRRLSSLFGFGGIKKIPYRVIFAGLAYEMKGDNAKKLNDVLSDAGGYFNDYRIVVYENDPLNTGVWEQTKSNSKFLALQDSFNFGVSAYGAEGKTSCGRTRLLAFYRNRLLDVISSLHTDSLSDSLFQFDADFVIMIDLDMIEDGKLNKHSVGNLLATLHARIEEYGMDQFDVLCADALTGGSRSYYDRYALMLCDAAYYQTIWPRDDHHQNLDVQSLADQLGNGGEDLVRVRSCFGGFAVYRMEALLASKCRYKSEASCYCEHMPFNVCLAQKGFDSIFVDQKMSFTV